MCVMTHIMYPVFDNIFSVIICVLMFVTYILSLYVSCDVYDAYSVITNICILPARTLIMCLCVAFVGYTYVAFT